MEETDKTEITTLKENIRAELERVGCKEIDVLTVPIENTGSTEIIHAIELDYFTKNADYYHVQVTKCIDQDWNDRLRVKVQLTRIFNSWGEECEKIPISSLTIDDTLTVFKQWDDSSAVRLVHRVSGSITCKTPCDANTAKELVSHIFEISKL